MDGVTVAASIGEDPACVYKTLVTQGSSKNYFVFVIPVAAELDLKAAARSVGEKSVAMIHVADINKVTGYVRGGCSPVGMKKQYRTVFDESVLTQQKVYVSGGRIGTQVDIKNSIDTAKQEGLAEGMEKGMELGIEKGMKKGMEKGLEKGMKKGMNQKALDIARNMLADGVDINLIMKYSGLTQEQIEKLK